MLIDVQLEPSPDTGSLHAFAQAAEQLLQRAGATRQHVHACSLGCILSVLHDPAARRRTRSNDESP